MKHIRLAGSTGQSLVVVGESIERLESYCDGARCLVVTDATVRALHGFRFPLFGIIEMGEGEELKTLRTAQDIYETLLSLEIDRSVFLVAVGGGIVCDVAGFVASTYLRGLRFGFVPTTLLAQVDASVGGKNGVNLRGYKNLVGTFAQPRFVLCDPELLRTLPLSELRNGFAEVVKHAAIGSQDFFAFLENNWEAAMALSSGTVERVVHESLSIKATVVARDEMERGERRILNFGHTIGHAVEKVHHLRHGEAVSIGMAAAARLSVAKRLLSESDAARLEGLLINFGLPVRMSFDTALVIDALKKDKKREGNLIHFVLLDAIGHGRMSPMDIGEIEKVINDMCELS